MAQKGKDGKMKRVAVDTHIPSSQKTEALTHRLAEQLRNNLPTVFSGMLVMGRLLPSTTVTDNNGFTWFKAYTSWNEAGDDYVSLVPGSKIRNLLADDMVGGVIINGELWVPKESLI